MSDELIDNIIRTLELTEPLSREYIAVALGDIRTFDAKQHDRGPENIARHGEQGVLLRCWDKLARINRVVWDGVEPKVSEPVVQEWVDLSVYGVIARMCRNGQWPGVPAPRVDAPTLTAPTEIGCVVEVIGTDWCGPELGARGKVVAVELAPKPASGGSRYAVAFDKSFGGGHSCGRQVSQGYGYWFDRLDGQTGGITIRPVC